MTGRTRSAAAFVLLMTAVVLFPPIGATATPQAPPTAAQVRPVIVITASAVQDGTRYVYEISSENSARLPRWDPAGGSEPPVSIGQARIAAEMWLKGRAPEVKALELTGLTLLRGNAAGVWYYRVTYDPVLGGRRLPGGRDFTAVVLLDGSVVEPRTEPFSPPAAAGRGGPSRPPAGAPVRVGGDIKPPERIRNVNPVYPPDAQASRVQGVVIIEATIGTDGHVTDARVLRSIPLLDDAAVAAVRQWEYVPTMMNGVAVPIIMTVTVNFSLQ